MRLLRALIDIIKFPIKEKVVACRNIVFKMTANPYFQQPYISLADFTLAINALEAAIIAADDGSHTAKSNMHDKAAVVDNFIRVYAQYVNQVANGDETKLLSSGFNISKDTPSVSKPILSVVDGLHSGELKFITKAIYAAGVYIWQIYIGGIPTLESDWKTVEMTTSASYLLKDLEVGTLIGVRVAAITPSGTTEFCVPVVKLVN